MTTWLGVRASLLCFVASGLLAQQSTDPDERIVGERGAAIAALVRGMEAHGFCGAVLAARDGEIVAALGVGLADPATKRRNTARTLFEIASATKQFTAAAILVLQQDGKLTLDDPIGKHLPAVPKHAQAVTVRHLLQHTSGFPPERTAGGQDDLAKSVRAFLGEPPSHPPGERFGYWNPGYALLAGIVERASGQSYVAFCQRRLFVPAGMSAATFTGERAPAGVPVATGAEGPVSRPALGHPYGSYGFQYRGMGGAVCNVYDLWRWDRALAADKVLTTASKELLFRPGLEQYALGWRVTEVPGRGVLQEHGGDVAGFHTAMRRHPDRGVFVVVLTNGSGALRHEVADAVTAMLFDEPSPIVPAELAGRLVGAWRSERGDVLRVQANGPLLEANLEWVAGQRTRGSLVGSDLATLAWFEAGTGQRYPVTCGQEGGSFVSLGFEGMTFRR
ncbi:MAG: serine hydrolase domain-containing protein [Planctomycetota bacterium]